MPRLLATLAGMALVAALCLIAGWLFMLGVAAVHVWLPAVPTIGYLDAVAIVGCLRATVIPFETRAAVIRDPHARHRRTEQ
jgi:CHASE2 domain-containing sensor protein